MKLAAQYPSRIEAAKALARELDYKIGPTKAFETYEAFADAVGLKDGYVTSSLRRQVEDYLLPPLSFEPENRLNLNASIDTAWLN